MVDAVTVIGQRLKAAVSFVEIFGTLPKGDLSIAQKALKKSYAYLAKQVHPDMVPKALQAEAQSVFGDLVHLHDLAKTALQSGTYEKRFVALSAGFAAASSHMTIVGGKGRYEFASDIFVEGDFSNLYQGTNEAGEAVFAKVAIDPRVNSYLAHESSVLGRASDAVAKSLRPYLPELLESVVLTEVGNEQFRVNVFRYKPGYVSLTEVRKAYPNGVAPEVAAWMWRRVLGQALAARTIGVVHGAIVPDHVLVHPVSHDPLHIGWAHSVIEPWKRGGRIETHIDRWRDWYSPEVTGRRIPTHQTDLYMAGKSMLYLLGGDTVRNTFPRTMPPQIEKLIRQCLETDPGKRPADGLALLREFTSTVHTLWGKTYRPLTLPV